MKRLSISMEHSRIKKIQTQEVTKFHQFKRRWKRE